MVELPRGYEVSRDVIAPSRWMVSYKGDPFFFMERTNAIGGERIKTFKTKGEAIQAIREHVAMIADLKAQSQAASRKL